MVTVAARMIVNVAEVGMLMVAVVVWIIVATVEVGALMVVSWEVDGRTVLESRIFRYYRVDIDNDIRR